MPDSFHLVYRFVCLNYRLNELCGEGEPDVDISASISSVPLVSERAVGPQRRNTIPRVSKSVEFLLLLNNKQGLRSELYLTGARLFEEDLFPIFSCNTFNLDWSRTLDGTSLWYFC